MNKANILYNKTHLHIHTEKQTHTNTGYISKCYYDNYHNGGK